jgi:hypothetical protein
VFCQWLVGDHRVTILRSDNRERYHPIPNHLEPLRDRTVLSAAAASNTVIRAVTSRRGGVWSMLTDN